MSWPTRIIRWLFYLLFFSVPLFFLTNTSELFEFPKIILTYSIATAIAAAWIADCILQKRFIFKRTPLDWPLLIFLFSQSLSLLFSISTHVSWHGYYSRFNGGLASLIAYAFLYWAAVTHMDRRHTLYVIRYTLISALIVSLYGTLEHFGFSPSCVFTTGTWDVSCWIQDVQGRVFATLGQPNWMAAYLVALMFIPLSKILSSKKFPTTYYLLFTIYFSALLFTKSRSGFLAFGISSLVFWSLAIWKAGPKKLKNYLGFGVWCLIISFLFFSIENPVRDRFLNLFTKTAQSAPQPSPTQATETVLESGITDSGNIRKIVWSGAIKIWQANTKNFLLGTGPETFAMSYYQYRPQEHNMTTEWELLYNKAHNEFLNYLANTGLLGLGSYLVLLIAILLNFKFLILNPKSNPNDQMIKLALATGWLSILVTNFWGFSVVIVQIFLFLFPAMAQTLEQEGVIVEEKKKNISGAQILAILAFSFSPALILLYSTSRYLLADVAYADGLYNLRAFTATQEPSYLISSYQKLTESYKLNPSEPTIASDLSFTAGYLALATRDVDATSSSQITRIAISASDKAISINSHHPNIFKNRSRMFILLSDLDPEYLALADEALAKAAVISPTDPRVPYNRGIIANYQNLTDLARTYFQTSLDLKPDFNDPEVRLKELSTPSALVK